MNKTKPKLAFPVQGWKQFLSGRQEILARYDSARTKAGIHEIETYHGKVAEAEFRKWLMDFLPKKYGVTSGYVVSQGMDSKRKAPHYDVIIYDSMDSPVLWIEEDADTSRTGRSMAIPAEHVKGVLEVKATLTPAHVKKAIEHLRDLSPLMENINDSIDGFPVYLPDDFFCGTVFFELGKKYQFSVQILKEITHGLGLRGFYGGIVLRGDCHQKPLSGMLRLAKSDKPSHMDIGPDGASLLGGAIRTFPDIQIDKIFLGSSLIWQEAHFSQFAFDIVALLNGTYDPKLLSSWHGIGSSDWEEYRGENS